MNRFVIDPNGNIDIDLRKNILLEASAGTGKTYTLERVVLNLIKNPKYNLSIKDILVVTFTNKATREMKERIRRIFVESYRKEKDPLLRGNIERAIADFDEASIFTIHGFCQNTLQTYPFESFSLFDQELNKDDEQLRGAVWDYIRLIKDSKNNLVKGFNLFKGSGTITSAVDKIVSLYQKDDYRSCKFYPTYNDICFLEGLEDEFNSQKGDIYNTIESLKKYDVTQFHGASKAMKCGTRVTSFEKLQAMLQGCTGLAFYDFMSLFYSKGFAENAYKLTSSFLISKSKKGLTPEDVDTAEREIIYLFDTLFANFDWLFDKENLSKNPMDMVLIGNFISTTLKEVDLIFEVKQEKNGLLSFSDLIDNLHGRLMEGGENPLLQSLRKRYKVALIDEFQDTDKKQWDIFSRVFLGSPEHNFLLIGDPKQSIYGFRGADLEIYYKAKESVSNQDRYVLDTNYRSEDGIICGCNTIFKPLFDVPGKGYTHKTTFESANTPTGAQKKVQRNLSSVKQNIEFLLYDQEVEEGKTLTVKECKKGYFKAIVNKIMSLLVKDKNSPGEIVILVESHKDSQYLRDNLQRKGIPVVISKQRNVFCSREAKDILFLLNALNRPGGLGEIKALLLSPLFEYSLKEVHDLETNGGIEEVSSTIFSWVQVFNNSGLIALWEEVEKSSKHGNLEERILKKINGERSYTNYKHLIENLNTIHRAERLNSLSLRRRLYELMAKSSEDEDNSVRLDRESEAVQIMTIHASKGLEFPIVFFAGGLTKSGSPTHDYGTKYYDKSGDWVLDFINRWESKLLNERDQWEEKKRLYYVAFTRASSKLYLPLFPNGELMLLSSLYGSINWDENKTMIEDRCGDKLLSLEMPVHRQLKIDNSKLSKEIKAAYTRKIYDDVVNLVDANSSLFYIDNKTYLDNSLSHYETEKSLDGLVFTDIKSTFGFGNRVTWLSSYSGLTRDSHGSASKEDADREDDNEDQVVEYRTTGEINHFNIPGGASFGDLVHEFFEEVDFGKYALPLEDYLLDPQVNELFLNGAKKHFNLDWARLYGEAAKTLTWNTLNSSLNFGGNNAKLGEISKENKIHEKEFYFRVDKKESLNLYGLELQFDKGYLKGFIDLIINFNGVLYIADWKTTTIKGHEEFENYSQDRVEESMKEHSYHLQGLIYTVALYLHLKKTKKDFDYNKDIGGYFYFYVRGMGTGSNTGVSFRKPEESEVLGFIRGIRND